MKSQVSKHYKKSRYKREKFIDNYLNEGHIIDGFIVDKGHPMGVECHSITDNGIIIVHNIESGKLVTKLIARPQQIKRYYEFTGRETPPEYEHILEVARQHNIAGYNEL